MAALVSSEDKSTKSPDEELVDQLHQTGYLQKFWRLEIPAKKAITKKTNLSSFNLCAFEEDSSIFINSDNESRERSEGFQLQPSYYPRQIVRVDFNNLPNKKGKKHPTDKEKEIQNLKSEPVSRSFIGLRGKRSRPCDRNEYVKNIAE